METFHRKLIVIVLFTIQNRVYVDSMFLLCDILFRSLDSLPALMFLSYFHMFAVHIFFKYLLFGAGLVIVDTRIVIDSLINH